MVIGSDGDGRLHVPRIAGLSPTCVDQLFNEWGCRLDVLVASLANVDAEDVLRGDKTCGRAARIALSLCRVRLRWGLRFWLLMGWHAHFLQVLG